MWLKGLLKRFGRIEEQMPHGNVRRRRAGRQACNSLVDGSALHRRAKELLHQRNVLVAVVGNVEFPAFAIGVENADLDHLHPPTRMFRVHTGPAETSAERLARRPETK